MFSITLYYRAPAQLAWTRLDVTGENKIGTLFAAQAVWASFTGMQMLMQGSHPVLADVREMQAA